MNIFGLMVNKAALIASISYIVWAIACIFFVSYLDNILKKVVKNTETKLDDILLMELRNPVLGLLLILGIHVVSLTVGLPSQIEKTVGRTSELSIIFIIIYSAARILLDLIKSASDNNIPLRNMLPTFSRVANAIIWGSGILMLMDIFGISLTPVLASLGIAGIAVGLAMQDTLSNFFAGTYLLINQPIRVGDYIELENNIKGYIESVGWRETRIKNIANYVIVVPNNKLSQSIITNYYLPEKEMACLVQVGVSYDSDLAKVEKITNEVSKQVLSTVTGAVNSFNPFIRYHTFSDFSINFTVILRIAEYVDQYLVTHEFIKALHKRYKEEGIKIPYPIRDINITNNTNTPV